MGVRCWRLLFACPQLKWLAGCVSLSHSPGWCKGFRLDQLYPFQVNTRKMRNWFFLTKQYFRNLGYKNGIWSLLSRQLSSWWLEPTIMSYFVCHNLMQWACQICSGRGCSVLCVIQPPAVAALWDGGAGDGGSILFSKSARVSILRHGFLIPAILIHLKRALIGKGYIEDFSWTFGP